MSEPSAFVTIKSSVGMQTSREVQWCYKHLGNSVIPLVNRMIHTYILYIHLMNSNCNIIYLPELYSNENVTLVLFISNIISTVIIGICSFLSEIQGIWAGSEGGGDWWAATGEETS